MSSLHCEILYSSLDLFSNEKKKKYIFNEKKSSINHDKYQGELIVSFIWSHFFQREREKKKERKMIVGKDSILSKMQMSSLQSLSSSSFNDNNNNNGDVSSCVCSSPMKFFDRCRSLPFGKIKCSHNPCRFVVRRIS